MRWITFCLLLLAVDAHAERRQLLYRASSVAAAGISSPADIANLYAWYKGNSLVTNAAGTTPPSDGDFIIAWGDKSGNGHDLSTNSNPLALPLKWFSAATTGRTIGGVESGGANSYLRVGFTALPDTTIFILWRINSSGAYVLPLDSTNSLASQAIYKSNGDAFAMYSGTEVTGGTTVSGTFYVQTCQFNSGGNDTMRTNGVVISAALNSGNQSLDGLTVGASRLGATQPVSGEYMVEIAIYNRLLNTTEMSQVETYLLEQ
jgi:hypothetical protein